MEIETGPAQWSFQPRAMLTHRFYHHIRANIKTEKYIFCARYFRISVVVWKLLYSDSNLYPRVKIKSLIGWDDYLASNWRQTVLWSTAGLVYKRIYVSLGPEELFRHISLISVHCVPWGCPASRGIQSDNFDQEILHDEGGKYINGSVQDCSISIANELEILQSCTEPSIDPITFACWRHQMGTFFALLALCAENSPVTGKFTSQRPVRRSFYVFFDLLLNTQLSKQSWGWWIDTPSCPLWRHYNGCMALCFVVVSLFRAD